MKPIPKAPRPNRLILLNLMAVAGIGLLDGMVAAGIVVGILFVIPILASSTTDRPRDVAIVFAAAILAFILAKQFGNSTAPTADVIIPNRLLVVLALAGSAYIALLLQRRRVEARRIGDGALKTAAINRLIMALIAHDLRSPLATALHTLEYLDASVSHPGDRDLIAEAGGRLRRSIRVVDAFLSIAAAEDPKTRPDPSSRYITNVQLDTILTEEVRAFEVEAEARGKRLKLDLSGLAPGTYDLDVRVLRQAITILVDNAIRYAVPGPIRITGKITGDEVLLTVEDTGPGISAASSRGTGMGLGLELCGALVHRADGSLEVVRDRPEGTTFVLRMPVRIAEVH